MNYENIDIGAALGEVSGGRGPDVCIEAVGCKAHSPGFQNVYDQVKVKLKLETDRPIAVREAGAGGTVRSSWSSKAIPSCSRDKALPATRLTMLKRLCVDFFACDGRGIPRR
ncbi:hypothetical protein [Amycolatopsis sp. cmx-4-54]|uniref:hypothetical protein n=1 Tax=Amycolatopsis sp. cmx-4-54 TaxID=2790936 RepID=UPI00397CAF9B